MIRRIIKIDQNKCDGCGLCVQACHEGAIGLVDGKATLLREDYCDGLGDCLPACPAGAITFEQRQAQPYDEQAVQAAKKQAQKPLPCGCPGSMAKAIRREEAHECPQPSANPSRLRQWPVQIKLAPVNAPYFDGAHLLVAADCTAYAYGNFHNELIRDRIVLVGCPKLDGVDYAEKLSAILAGNRIQSVTCVRMEVPCCGGLEQAVKQAIKASGKHLPWQVLTISTDGRMVE